MGMFQMEVKIGKQSVVKEIVAKEKGFTLIEMMIVVAVIAIISAIAYPSYTEHVKKTKRVEMQTHLAQLALNLENYKLANHNYAQANLSNYGGTRFPTQGAANYGIELTDINGEELTSSDANTQSWLLVARPLSTSGQKGTGVISINSNAIKCWYKNNDIVDVASLDEDSCTEKW